MDHVRWVRRGEQEALLIVEVKAQAESSLGLQLFGYYSWALVAYDFTPIVPLALILRPGGSPGGEKPLRLEALGREYCRFEFAVFHIYELHARRVLEEGRPGLLALSPLMRGAEEALIARASERIEQSSLPARVQSDLQAALVLLTSAVLDVSDIDRLIPREVYMESTLYQRILEEGELKALQEVLRRDLQRRFGTVPEWAEERLLGIESKDKLLELHDRVADLSSEEELRQLLG
jgi:hypothetical protein